MNNEPMEHLTDVLDLASRNESLAAAARIEQIRNAAASKRKPLDPGYCDTCGGATETPAHLFCSIKCRDDDALLERQLLRQGRKR